MIDEVHMLTGHAFNAMLKTLEEPPEYLKFVLATTDPQKVPATVLSRCLQFNLRPMAPETVAEHLAQVLQAEGVAGRRRPLRLLSRGRARLDARRAVAHRPGHRLRRRRARGGGGARRCWARVDRSHAIRWSRRSRRRDGKAVLAEFDALRELGLSAAGTLEEMARRAAAHGGAAGRARRADAERCRHRGRAARLAAADAGRRDAAALQHRASMAGRSWALRPTNTRRSTMVLLRLLAFKPRGASCEKKALQCRRAPDGAGAPRSSRRDRGAAHAVGVRSSRRRSRARAVTAPSPRRATAAPPRAGRAAAGRRRRRAHVRDVMARARRARHRPREASSSAPLVASAEGDFWHDDRAPAGRRREAIARAGARAGDAGATGRARRRATGCCASSARSLQPAGAAASKLQAALATRSGTACSSRVEVGRRDRQPGATQRRRATPPARGRAGDPLRSAGQAIRSLQHMMRDLGAEIVPGSIKPPVAITHSSRRTHHVQKDNSPA